ncbi:putative facilitated trehalose transporter Tret1-like isoform X2 [Penaeus vannamei]|uniref:Putative facilitated trehalose transporter Tret1-like isoform X2 n=1 Tax=Penaeus vannamei TaxID=6689 RepID=A0A3R7LSB4_PENVA|nr:putative facilitated trehalose transporter Tret1-like isoform X2 [Penaeus vannamei]
MSFKTWFIYRWRQILASVVLVCTTLCTGFVVGWSVEVSRIMEDPRTNFNMTQDDQQWLVSCAGIAAVFTTLGSGAVVEAIGPCRLLSFALLPPPRVGRDGGHGLPAVGLRRQSHHGGMGLMMTTVVQPLIAEICQADVRASSPPSPRSWSLMKLRAPEHDVDAELHSIRDALNSQNGSIVKQFRALKDPGNWRPVLLVTSIFILRELGGAMVIFMYAVYFFENAGVQLDPFTCSVLLGVCRVVFTFISAVTIDKLGRRPLLICSSVVCGLSMFVTGGVLYSGDTNISWIPLTAVMVYVASFGLGAGPVPWILLGELLPTPVRSLGASLCTGIFVLLLFVITEVFPDLTSTIGLEDAVLAFGSFFILMALVAFFFLPETNCRTLEELQHAFVGGTALTSFSHAGREGYTPAYGSTFPSTSQVTEKVH